MARVGWLIDVNQCISCRACETACKAEYGLNAGQGRRRKVVEKTTQEVISPDCDGHQTQVTRTFFISLACNHCDEPACLKACPKNAYTKDTTGAISGLEGAVLHNPALCVGCRRCEWACPYGAPQYNPANGKIHKCELCWQRIQAWRTTHAGYIASSGEDWGTITKPLHPSEPGYSFNAAKAAAWADRRRMPACVATCLGGTAIQLRNDFDAGGPIGAGGVTTGKPYLASSAGSDLAYEVPKVGTGPYTAQTTIDASFAAPGEAGGEGTPLRGKDRGSNFLAYWSLTYPAVRIRNRVYVKRDGGVE